MDIPRFMFKIHLIIFKKGNLKYKVLQCTPYCIHHQKKFFCSCTNGNSNFPLHFHCDPVNSLSIRSILNKCRKSIPSYTDLAFTKTTGSLSIKAIYFAIYEHRYSDKYCNLAKLLIVWRLLLVWRFILSEKYLILSNF